MTTPTRTFDPRPLIALLLVPIVAYGSSAAHYGVRTVAVLYFTGELGWPFVDAYFLYASTTWAMLAGAVLAAVVGALIGGWGTAVLGLCIATLGIAGMAVFPDPTLPFLMAAVGRGMTTVGLLAVLADAFRGQRNWLLVAGFALFFASGNVAGMVAPVVVGSLGVRSGFAAVFGTSAAIAGVATVLALGAAIAWYLLAGPYPEPDQRRSKVSMPPHLLALGLTLVGVPTLLLYNEALNVAFALTTEVIEAGIGGAEMLLTLNPIVVVAGAVTIAVVAIALHLLRVPSRPLVIAGVGAVLVGASVVVAILAGWPPSPSALMAMFGVVGLGAIGEILLATFLFAGWARDLHWRLVTPLVGLWRAALIGIPALFWLVSRPDWVDPAIGVSASAWLIPGSLLVLGVVLAVAGVMFAKYWRGPDLDDSAGP